MFRRRSQDAPAAATALADEQAAQPRNPQAPKGRPTPKRSEAQASRRTRTSVPKDRKEAARDARTRMRAEREKQRLALLNGDERALPARDKGPVRRFARDFVDSRFTVAEWFLPFAVVILILSVLRNPALQFVSLLMWLVVIVGIVLDSVRHAVVLRKQLQQRFPNESHKGVTAYALMRTLQMRRLRLPKPQVKRGAKL
ncbi:DUF3043 domain-containing protein [Streptacidiphilus sp. ASG 303]|uniref:DUF3043 domain-containing protein n=1 Tax=Streptacidiphilus sp. ASG 303 TaxID=2896847 RepID=UPI001E5E9BC6|nr:DUF3043 domain-containing protein [Streptacidiphilus sp. ASG 303]MCD0481716.1 DUF3043 domain-containing protein [Streptacidiphilus sp. ASG 303]